MAAVVESSCRVELLVSLQSSDGLVEVEVEDDEAGEGLESVSRREALDRLDRETFESRRRAAKALPLTTLERFADAFDDEREVVAACRSHVSYAARVRPSDLVLPRDFGTAAASGALRVACGGESRTVALVFDSRRWFPWQYSATSTELCSGEFERYVAYHYEVACRLVDRAGPSRQFDVLVKVADRPDLLRPCALKCVHTLVTVARQYPLRLRTCYLLGAPPLFSAAWRLIRPLLDERTANATVFVADEDAEATIANVLGPEAPSFAAEGSVGAFYCGPLETAVDMLEQARDKDADAP